MFLISNIYPDCTVQCFHANPTLKAVDQSNYETVGFYHRHLTILVVFCYYHKMCE